MRRGAGDGHRGVSSGGGRFASTRCAPHRGLGGGYVQVRDQRSRKAGWFDVIAGKSIPAGGAAKGFGCVHMYDTTPKRSLLLKSQGMPENQQVTFLSDGGDTVRELQMSLHPEAEHVLGGRSEARISDSRCVRRPDTTTYKRHLVASTPGCREVCTKTRRPRSPHFVMVSLYAGNWVRCMRLPMLVWGSK